MLKQEDFTYIEGFGYIRTGLYKGNRWFVIKDISELIGRNNHKRDMKNYISEKNKAKVRSCDIGLFSEVKITITNEKGLFEYLTQVKSCEDKSKKLLETLKQMGFIKSDIIVVTQRKEIHFINKLEEVLKGIGIHDGKSQYKIFNYRIDYYIPSLRIAIEYDENNHVGYTYERQELRQEKIEEELQCRFIRVTDKETDEYNIGIVIKELFNINIK